MKQPDPERRWRTTQHWTEELQELEDEAARSREEVENNQHWTEELQELEDEAARSREEVENNPTLD